MKIPGVPTSDPCSLPVSSTYHLFSDARLNHHQDGGFLFFPLILEYPDSSEYTLTLTNLIQRRGESAGLKCDQWDGVMFAADECRSWALGGGVRGWVSWGLGGLMFLVTSLLLSDNFLSSYRRKPPEGRDLNWRRKVETTFSSFGVGAPPGGQLQVVIKRNSKIKFVITKVVITKVVIELRLRLADRTETQSFFKLMIHPHFGWLVICRKIVATFVVTEKLKQSRDVILTGRKRSDSLEVSKSVK